MWAIRRTSRLLPREVKLIENTDRHHERRNDLQGRGGVKICGRVPANNGDGMKRSSHRLPDGQISDFLSSPFCKNISVHFKPKSPLHLWPSRSRKRGVSRSSRTLGAGCNGRGMSKDE
jgi:hypothetical protein